MCFTAAVDKGLHGVAPPTCQLSLWPPIFLPRFPTFFPGCERILLFTFHCAMRTHAR